MSQLELTRAGWRNIAQQQRSSLQRVAYHIEDQNLWRSYWWVLDRAQDTRPIRMNLLNDVDEIKLRYLDGGLQWHDQWPPLTAHKTLKAVEVTLIVVGWGRIVRLFRVPDNFLK